MGRYLDKINKPNDIKNIPRDKYNELAMEIREFLIDKVSKTGGHLASNLGAVDLTIALHSVLNFPEDKIVWDVGHQAYTHKILTGRKDMFDNLREYNGLSGFPKKNESDCDCFDTGHSSTSISAALGIATANAINCKSDKVVAVIGDGALTGGMAYEALNNAAALKKNFVIILNDNNMSIAENVGSMSGYLNKIRVGEHYNELKIDVEQSLNKIPGLGSKLVKGIKKTKDNIKQFFVPGKWFDELGITYIGPIDGHNIAEMREILEDALKLEHPVLIHVLTKKGKGYEYAEKYPTKFHGIDPFDKMTGNTLKAKGEASNTEVFSKALVSVAETNKDIVAITAAMPDGTGLNRFKEHYPDRFFDVGIAEEHAVTFAAGLAAGGKKPFVSIYSSFYQRAFDQIIHDVCIQKLPVVLIVDRAGLVGKDGETHQGIFDISFMSMVPNLTILSPKNKEELIDSVKFAAEFDGPIAIRFSRGSAYTGFTGNSEPIKLGKSEILNNGKDVAILAVGNMVEETEKAVEHLKEQGVNPTFVNARFVKPLDTELISELVKNHSAIVTVEESITNGGYGENVTAFLAEEGLNVKNLNISIKDRFVAQGLVSELRKELKLDWESISERILELIK